EREVPVGEELEGQQRVASLTASLLREEQRDERDPRNDDDRDRHERTFDRSPLVPLALDEAEDDAEESHGREEHAGEVETVRASGSQIRDDTRGERQDRDADRDVHVEDPAPAPVRHDESAERRAEDDREAREHAEDREDAATPFRREEARDHRKALRSEERRTKTLAGARQHQLRRVLREAGERGREREERDNRGEQRARHVG